jgi:hypothetical protein
MKMSKPNTAITKTEYAGLATVANVMVNNNAGVNTWRPHPPLSPMEGPYMLFKWAQAYHSQFESAARVTKMNAFEAGLCLLEAKQMCPGEFLQQIEQNCDFSQRTAYRYMEFTNEMINQCKLENPAMTRVADIVTAARQMAMDNAKKFTELLREAKVIRDRPANGARDGKEARENRVPVQMEFDGRLFGTMLSAIDQVPMDEESVNPFEDWEIDALRQTAQRLKKAEEMVQQVLLARAIAPTNGTNEEDEGEDKHVADFVYPKKHPKHRGIDAAMALQSCDFCNQPIGFGVHVIRTLLDPCCVMHRDCHDKGCLCAPIDGTPIGASDTTPATSTEEQPI